MELGLVLHQWVACSTVLVSRAESEEEMVLVLCQWAACEPVVLATQWQSHQQHLAWVWFAGLYLNNLEYVVMKRG